MLSLLTTIIGTIAFSSAGDSAPVLQKNVHEKTQSHSAQQFLENLLRQQGALKENEHLLPHEVWKLTDFIKEQEEKTRFKKMVK